MKKPNIMSRVGTYGINRIQPSAVREGSRQAMSSGRLAAMQALRPTAANPAELMAGLNGRYEDGGRERFATMMSEMGLVGQDLSSVEAAHNRNFALLLGSTGAFMAGTVVMILFGSGSFGLMAAIILTIFALASAVNAIRADYSAWQIRQRAFGGFREYLRSRFFAAGG